MKFSDNQAVQELLNNPQQLIKKEASWRLDFNDFHPFMQWRENFFVSAALQQEAAFDSLIEKLLEYNFADLIIDQRQAVEKVFALVLEEDGQAQVIDDRDPLVKKLVAAVENQEELLQVKTVFGYVNRQVTADAAAQEALVVYRTSLTAAFDTLIAAHEKYYPETDGVVLLEQIRNNQKNAFESMNLRVLTITTENQAELQTYLTEKVTAIEANYQTIKAQVEEIYYQQNSQWNYFMKNPYGTAELQEVITFGLGKQVDQVICQMDGYGHLTKPTEIEVFTLSLNGVDILLDATGGKNAVEYGELAINEATSYYLRTEAEEIFLDTLPKELIPIALNPESYQWFLDEAGFVPQTAVNLIERSGELAEKTLPEKAEAKIGVKILLPGDWQQALTNDLNNTMQTYLHLAHSSEEEPVAATGIFQRIKNWFNK